MSPRRRSGKERAQNFDTSVIPDNVRAKFNARKGDMLDSQEEQQASIVSFESDVHNVLDDEGLVGVMRVPYLNVAREAYRATGHNAGAALQTMFEAIKAKATTKGLTESIVNRVLEAVWAGYTY